MATYVKNPHDIIIGTGPMYVNGSSVGQLKNDVVLKHAKEYYEEKAGFPEASILKIPVSEEASFTVELLEANLDVLAALMPEYSISTSAAGSEAVTHELVGAVTSTRKTGSAYPKWTNATVTARLATTLSTAAEASDTVLNVTDASPFTAGDTITLKVGATTENATIAALGVDEAANTLTVTAGLSAGFAAGATVVNTAVDLVEGTDYYLDRIDGAIWRVSTSTAIAENDQIALSYTYTTYTGRGITAGGLSNQTYYVVRFEHTRRDGKIRVVTLYRCQVTADLEVAFKAKESAPIPVTITVFSDSTRAAGDQLFSIIDLTV